MKEIQIFIRSTPYNGRSRVHNAWDMLFKIYHECRIMGCYYQTIFLLMSNNNTIFQCRWFKNEGQWQMIPFLGLHIIPDMFPESKSLFQKYIFSFSFMALEINNVNRIVENRMIKLRYSYRRAILWYLSIIHIIHHINQKYIFWYILLSRLTINLRIDDS